MRKPLKNLIGITFGKLTVIEPSNDEITYMKKMWVCKCNCGNIKNIWHGSLLTGETKTCGCSHKTSHCTHGQSNPNIHSEYRIWSKMKDRCYNRKTPNYSRYGAVGIKVSEEWKNSYEAFIRDMGKRPSPIHSIDRIDNDGNYCKENCRWATPKEQCRNKHFNIWLEHEGENMIVEDWAIKLKIQPSSISYKLSKGYTIAEIIEYYKIHGYKSSITLKAEQVIEIKKKLKQKISQYVIAKEFNVSRSTILQIHLNKNWKHIVI